MELNVIGHNLKVSDAVEEYVEKKVGKLDHYLPSITSAKVELSRQSAKSADDRHVVQLTVYSNHTILRAEERNADLFAAVDAVSDKMHRQIARYKGKHYHSRKSQSAPAVAEEIEEPAEEIEEGELVQHQIVRRKRFEAAPMTDDEAIEQMELLGHDFFVYYNADTASVNVVYRRHDGNYGVLEPIIG